MFLPDKEKRPPFGKYHNKQHYAVKELHSCCDNKCQERHKSHFKSLFGRCLVHKFTKKGAQERAYYNSYHTKKKAYHKTYGGSPHAGFASTGFFCKPHRGYVVYNRYNCSQHARYDKRRGAHVVTVAKVEHKKPHKAKWRTGQHRHHSTQKAYKGKQERQQDKYVIHSNSGWGQQCGYSLGVFLSFSAFALSTSFISEAE